jgi:hypothetical protein
MGHPAGIILPRGASGQIRADPCGNSPRCCEDFSPASACRRKSKWPDRKWCARAASR